ncbi:MAG TPA: hypothetical protein DF637_01410 [Rikenellaceae bacterium]|nr:hypothetical protein [Rikenellaceae bacterium]
MKTLPLIAIMLVLFSCGKEIETKKINLVDLESNIGITEIVNLSMIADGIEYIPLQTKDQSLLTPPFKDAAFVNGRLYISQSRSEVKIFDHDGTFLKTFNKQGRGPQEYEDMSNIYIDPSTNNLLVYSIGKLNEYNNEGDFVKRILIRDNEEIKSFTPNKFYSIRENLKLTTFRNFKSLHSACVTDSTFRVLYYVNYSEKEHALRMNSQTSINFLEPYFYKFRDSVRVFNNYDGSLLTVSNANGVDTSYIFNYGKYNCRNVDLNVRDYNKLPLIRRFGDMFESTNYVFIQFQLGSLPHKPRIMLKSGVAGNRGETYEITLSTSLLNKKTGEFKFVDQPEFNQFGFKDDFEGGPAFWPVYISEDDYMIAMIDAYKFIQHAQANNVSAKFKKIAEGLKDTDNPILVRVKLKSE